MKSNSCRLLLPICLTFAVTGLLAMLAHAQDIRPDRSSVRLSNPSRPASVKVSLKGGGITVKGYDGNEVIVEARFRSSKASETGATRLKVEEQSNIVTIGAGPSDHPIDLTIQVPFKTSLNLSCATNGVILVENVEGEIEASNQGGAVTMTNVAGVVIADSRNGALRVQLRNVALDKPMSFSTVNGDIDVTLPPDIKAKIKLSAINGRTESDFDIGLSPEKPAGGGNSAILKSGGKELSLFHTTADINGGGAEISFRSVNGNVFLRKGGK